MRRFSWLLSLLIALAAQSCAAQFMTTLQQRTVDEFDGYAHRVETELDRRWNGKQPFLSLDDQPSERAKVVQGDLWIQPGAPNNPTAIYGGLVHDWVGAVFMPNTGIQKTLALLQDFNRHSRIYPNVKQSRLIHRDGNDVTGLWRLERKQSFVSVTLDVTQNAEWRQTAPGKWICRAYAKDIREIERPGTAQEKALAVGQGRGFLWRLYAYWSLQVFNGGVLGECRTLSLSRDVPPAVAWAIQPFIETLPREALAATLEDTRAAAEK
jgi:hypothetical protein